MQAVTNKQIECLCLVGYDMGRNAPLTTIVEPKLQKLVGSANSALDAAEQRRSELG
jgi:hypothetical protein